MLGKLLKYDLKNSFRFLVIFYSLSLIFAAAARILGDAANSTFVFVLSEIFKGASISMMFSTIINNSMRLWVMFKGSLYGDEAYLTHTLPIKKSTIYLSKILNAVITLVVSSVVVLLSFLIIFYSEAFLELFKGMLLPLTQAEDISIWGFAAVLLLILYVEFLNILQCGFSGIIIGHRFNTNKNLFSVIFGLVVYSFSQSVVLIPVLVAGILNSEIIDLFTSNIMPSFDVFKTILILAAVSYTAVCLILCLINIKLLKKGVNVD